MPKPFPMRGTQTSTTTHKRTWRAARAGLALVAIAAGLLASTAPAFADDPTAPDAPAQPTVTQITNTLSVAFVAPADGGSEMTGYAAECTSSDGGTPASNTGVDTPIVVGPLDYTTTYACTVIASNAIGDSPASDPSDDILIDTAAPDQPAKPDATTDGTSITLALDAPYDNGSAITQYDADCVSSDGGVEGTATSDSLPVAVDGLSLGKTYTCNLTATNGDGTSPASDDSDAVVIAAIVPDAPAPPSVLPDDGSITVTFEAPAENGSAISQYDADCVSSDGGTEGTGSGADTTPIVVTGVDNGNTYSCTVTATNDAGTSDPSEASADVIVGTPTIVGGTVVTPANQGAVVTTGDTVNDAGDTITSYTADCTSSDGGDPSSATTETLPVNVSGLTNGKTYTCTLFATNSRGDGPSQGESDPFSPVAIPGTPDAPTSVIPGDSKITVSFDAPDDSGDPITSYDVECDSTDGGTTGTASGSDSPIEVDGLDNTYTYTCEVRATNSSGTGLWSPMSEDVVIGPGVPDAPEINSITRGSNSVSVDFTEPDAHDSPITGYTVSCTSDDGGDPASNSDAASPIEVTGLTNSSYYTCTVDATNDVGTGDESPASEQFLAAAEPDAPFIAHLTRGNNSVTVDLVPGLDNGEPIDSYEVTCTSSDGGDPVTVDDSLESILVENLSNGYTYTCAATATNVMGTSVWSDDSAPFVAGTVPDAPTVTGVTRGNNSVAVAFTPGFDGSIEVRIFTATCTSSDGGTTSVNRGAASPITVNYLTNGKTYSCTIFASNAIGDGAESDPSDDFVAAATPRAPSISSITRGSNTVTVVFRSTSDANNPITNYTATCTSSNGGTTQSNTGATSPIVVSSLTNSKTYTCRVVATNALGDSPPSLPSAAFVAATAPDAPVVTGITRTSNAASVAFTIPANNGAAITAYRATCTSSDGGTTRTNTSTKSPISVTTLTNSKTYTCVTTAANIIGVSAASAPSSSFTAAATPSAPTVTGVTRGPSNVVVAFTAGSDGGDAITSFKVTCASSNLGATKTATGASSPITVITLTNAKTYTCNVAAINHVGTGTVSAASSSFIAANVPTAPKVSTLTRGSNSVSVAFLAPANNGAVITGYSVTCTSSNGGTTQSNTGASSPIVVSSLTNAKSYACYMTATNAIGTSLNGASSVFVAAAVPDAPTVVTATATKGTATVRFTAPSANGAAITKYTATCTSSDGGLTKFGIYTRSPVTVLQLTVTKTYTCTVTATNAIGTGAAAIASNTFTA